MSALRLCIAGVALLGALPAGAIEGRTITLDEALSLTRRNNRDLAAARATLEASKSGADLLRGALLPTVTATGTYTHNYRNVTFGNVFPTTSVPPAYSDLFSSVFGSLDNIAVLKQEALAGSLNVNVPIAAPAAYFSYDAARQNLHGAEADFAVSETAILFSAAQAFFAAAGADELLQARHHAIEVARVTLETAQARLHAGTVDREEVSRAQLALVNTIQAEREAGDMKESCYRSLGTIIGVHESFLVAPAPAETAPLPPPEALKDQALQLRPELEASAAATRAAAGQARAAAWQWAPTLSGFGALNGYNYAGFTGDKYSWDVGLQLSWVLYDGGVRDASRRQAEAHHAEHEAHLERLRDTVTDDVANATRGLETKRMALETAQQSVALASDTLSLLRTQYAAGTALQLDVLQAQDALIGAEVQLVQARFDLALAQLTLQRDVGTFPGELATR
jgi:outer membrane protein TolC